MKLDHAATADQPAVPPEASPSAPPLAGEPRPPLTREQLVVEIAVRGLSVAMLSIFLVSSSVQFARDPSRITLLLFAVAELLTIGLALFTRVPRQRDWNPLSVVLAFCATFYFLAFRVEPGIHLLPERVAAGIQIAGILVQISAKLSLRRSFGILPANRGVVVHGPYRMVRHPMYFGYLITDIGFLLPNFGIQNLVVLVVHWTLQVARLLREERLLEGDATYRDYTKRVPYRLIRGVF
jgi:protein-S-isoprenylcysteine O-methyltransferase Ste14